MASRTLVGDMETIAPTDNPVVSNLAASVSAILPVVCDPLDSFGRSLTPGYLRGAAVNEGVVAGCVITVQANGAGSVTILDSHRLPVAVVAPGTSKSFTAEGKEVQSSWIVQ